MTTLKAVNKALREAGHDVTLASAELARGKNYFYFRGDEPSKWFSASVMTSKLSSLSVSQWVKEYESMKNQNSG